MPTNTKALQVAEPAGFVAGKNKIINGDFGINQRAFSSTTSGGYGFDRWDNQLGGGTGTVTYSAQTFTAGTAPVSGYEGKNYLRCVTTSQSAAGTYTLLVQKIEDVRTFANQTVTISFWAKAASGTPKIAIELTQAFGSGGSPSSSVNTYVGQSTLTTSWARYSISVTVPSISGKTIGTDANSSSLNLNLWYSAGSTYDSRTGTLGIQSNTFDIWGVQVEAGSVATPFTTATGTIQGELAACQRYYIRQGGNALYEKFGIGQAQNSTSGRAFINLPVTMRVKPTSIDQNLLILTGWGSGSGTTITMQFENSAPTWVELSNVTAGSGWSGVMILQANLSTSAYLGFSAEL